MRMWEYIKRVNNEGTTIFLTTHYMDEANQFDRISIIDQGKIIISGKPWEPENTLGQDLIYMETSNNEAAIRLFKDLPSVRDVKVKTKGFVLMVTDDDPKVPPIVIDTLRKAGIDTSTINLKKPSMDDVFVSYTGKTSGTHRSGRLRYSRCGREDGNMPMGFTTIYWRDMIRFVRFKTLLVSSLLQPALWLAFFGIAMSSNFDQMMAGIPVPPDVLTVNYLTFMAAGIIAMTTLFTSLFGGIVILFDKNWGLMREILASPMNRNHIIFGIGLSGSYEIIYPGNHHHGLWHPDRCSVLCRVHRSGDYHRTCWGPCFCSDVCPRIPSLSAAIAISMESPEGLQGVVTLLTLVFLPACPLPYRCIPEFSKHSQCIIP